MQLTKVHRPLPFWAEAIPLHHSITHTGYALSNVHQNFGKDTSETFKFCSHWQLGTQDQLDITTLHQIYHKWQLVSACVCMCVCMATGLLIHPYSWTSCHLYWIHSNFHDTIYSYKLHYEMWWMYSTKYDMVNKICVISEINCCWDGQ